MLKIDVKTEEGLTPYRTELHRNILASGQLGRYIIEDHSGQLPLYHVSPRHSFHEILPSPNDRFIIHKNLMEFAKKSRFFTIFFEFGQEQQLLFLKKLTCCK
jgi:hypothetical protein